ncbi:MAG: hypothetical protein HYY13_13065 [Nitrospirae bacterium]|nr:hypothetical protein [Nitrospirota bacterium]
MKRGIMMIAVAVLAAACVSWPRGKVYKTAPQRWDYEELGPVKDTGFGWTREQAVNRAALDLYHKSVDRGGDGVVATELGEPRCYYFWSTLLSALIFPPCWVEARGVAVSFKSKGGDREE